MNQFDYVPQLTQHQSTYKKFKRSGCHDTLTPTNILTPEDRPVFLGRQEGLDSATANNSHAQRQLDVFNPTSSLRLSMPEPHRHINDAHPVLQSSSSTRNGRIADPPKENTRTHRTHAHQQADVFNSNLSSPQALTTPDIHRLTTNDTRSFQRRNDEAYGHEAFYSPRDSTTPSARTREFAPDRLDVFHYECRPERPSIVALEQRQRSHDPTTNDRPENLNQYNRLPAPSGFSWVATQGGGPSSTNDNSSSEGLPQRSIRQGVKAAINDREASQDRFQVEKSKTTRMKTSDSETLYQGLYHPGSTQIQVRNASSSQVPHTAAPAESGTALDVTQSNSIFQNAQGVNISGNPNFQNSVTNVYGGGKEGLEKLERFVSFDAKCDSSAQDPHRRCHPGTREKILKRLRDWVDDPRATERICWLYGPAGAGKSAIAQTIAHSYDQPKVAATYFFFRSDVKRNDGNLLFITLAYQLALSIPGIRDHIARALYERPDLPRTDVETQFKHLIARPFQVLNEDGTQQKLAPVIIIIDGVDECTDENLQQRFLKVIGDAVKDNHFPLRFLISSRPELHIEQTIRRFQSQTPIFNIDLAKFDDADRDIEKYLVDEFSRIASEQDLDPAWPGQKIIDDIVYKSSGNFIFASVVIKFVGDRYCFAKTQLEIVMNMKPLKTTSPFAVLDQLFLEILGRVPDQDFLRRYLAVLTARISVSGKYGDLYKDDAVLMHVSEEELHANLRRMRSLLRFEARIDVHHRSFLDFLHDSSRSGQYYIGKEGGITRYLEVFVDSLVRYVSTVIEQPDQHNGPHFTPRFRAMIKDFPPKIELPVNEWQEVVQPLLDLQDKLLQLPNLASNWPILRCDECTVFYLLRELLHLGLHLRRYQGQTNDTSVQSVMDVRKRTGVISSTTTKAEKKNGSDFDSILLSLFAHLPEIMENWLPDKDVIKLISTILCLPLDSTEMAKSVCFVSDAQKLVDLLVYLIDEKNALSRIHPNATRKATLLALEIFARVPILPLSSFLNGNNRLHPDRADLQRYIGIPIQILSQTIIASRVLDRHYIVPIWVVEDGKDGFMLVSGNVDGNDLSMEQWRRQRSNPSPMTAIQVMLGLAKAIQYFHSMGVVLYHAFGPEDVFLDSSRRPRIHCLYSTSRFLLDKQCKERFSHEDNTFSFGCLFYELFSGVDTRPSLSTKERGRIITERPSVPEIPAYVWQLIQCCCAEHPKKRPTINDVVHEMASWHIK